MSFLLCKTLYTKRDTSQILLALSADITWETSATAAVCDPLNHDTSGREREREREMYVSVCLCVCVSVCMCVCICRVCFACYNSNTLPCSSCASLHAGIACFDEVYSQSFLNLWKMNISWSSTCLQILHLATSLQVNDLRRVCEEALKRQVHIANIISTYHVARKFRLPNLEEYALNYMQVWLYI